MIVCCGSALVDMVPHAVPGGCNMNAAVTASRLGAPAAFLGRLSTDEYGDLLVAHMAMSGIDLSLIERGPERTARAVVTTSPTPSFEFDADGAADSALSRADLAPIGPGPHIIHGGTSVDYRGSTAEVLARLVETTDGLVSCDPNVRPTLIDDRTDWAYWHARWVACAGLYRCSEEDMAWTWRGRSADSIAGELLAGRAHVVIVTRGADGCEIFTPDWSIAVTSPPVTVVDTVGAGDGFVGSVLADLHQTGIRTDAALAEVGRSAWSGIAERAVRVAGIVCSRVGADPPWLHELGEMGP